MRSRRARRTRHGFTLVEVLVALLVVGAGVAAAAALQGSAVRAASEARRLSDGARLAASLAERMRANPVAMSLPDDANPYLQSDLAAAGGAPAAACYGAAGCSPVELARVDLAETVALLASRFPGGRMRVCRDAPAPGEAGLPGWACSGGPDDALAIKLGWHEAGAQAGAKPAPAVFLALGAVTP